ncbi:MAG: ADP-ribosylglycohydrolase family protein [Acidimicrobiales bacterium]|nr:ADP-ribosylglycohydrolase family protein [Acidimicrobiales bacterium]
MEIFENIETRFGPAAAKAVERQIGNPPRGSSDLQPAPKDRSRGALIGAVVGEALGEPIEDRPRNWIVANFGLITGHVAPNPKTGSDTQLTLMTADSILAGADAHPERFAARLAATTIDTRGQAVLQAQAAIREGRHWWSAATTFSAGTSGAARCAAFGLMWAGDPQRAAYEAALSTSVTHGHPVATSAAAAFAAAVALATNDDGPLDAGWLIAVADICAEFNQSDIDGATVIDRIRILPAMLTQSPEAALSILGTGPVAFEAVPAALWCAATARTPVEGLLNAVNAGGDTDTVAAMAGACLGARHGDGVWPSDLTQIVGLTAAVDAADRISQTTPVVPKPTLVGGSDVDVPVHVSFLIDRSGSMQGLIEDVVGGFNAFLSTQKSETGDCTMTLVQFDSQNPFEVLHDATPISQVPDLTRNQYQPRGGTPLLDALGDLVTSVDGRLTGLRTSEDQIVVVFSDGMENASSRWTRPTLFEAIKARKAAGWTFVYLGANQDSYEEAGRIGFDNTNVQNFRGDGTGTRHAMGSVDRAVRDYRRAPIAEKQLRKQNLFDDLKEAEADHMAR